MTNQSNITFTVSSAQGGANSIHNVTALTLASVGIILPIFTLILSV